MTYIETRSHELRKRSVLMIDGSLTTNLQSTDAGTSVRVQRDGYWGFAAGTGAAGAAPDRLQDQALRNATAMASFGPRQAAGLPGGSYQGRLEMRGRPAIGQKELLERLAALDAWCRARYPKAEASVRLRADEERHTKHVTNSLGCDALNGIARGMLYVTLSMRRRRRRARSNCGSTSPPRAAWPTWTCRRRRCRPASTPCMRHLLRQVRGGAGARRRAHRGDGAGAGRHPGARGHGPSVRSRPGARRRGHRPPGRPARRQRAGRHGRRGAHVRRPGGDGARCTATTRARRRATPC